MRQTRALPDSGSARLGLYVLTAMFLPVKVVWHICSPLYEDYRGPRVLLFAWALVKQQHSLGWSLEASFWDSCFVYNCHWVQLLKSSVDLLSNV